MQQWRGECRGRRSWGEGPQRAQPPRLQDHGAHRRGRLGDCPWGELSARDLHDHRADRARRGGLARSPLSSWAGAARGSDLALPGFVGRWPCPAWHLPSPPHTVAVALVLLLPWMCSSCAPLTPRLGKGNVSGHIWLGRHLARLPAVTLGSAALSSLFPGESSRFPPLVPTQ